MTAACCSIDWWPLCSPGLHGSSPRTPILNSVPLLYHWFIYDYYFIPFKEHRDLIQDVHSAHLLFLPRCLSSCCWSFLAPCWNTSRHRVCVLIFVKSTCVTFPKWISLMWKIHFWTFCIKITEILTWTCLGETLIKDEGLIRPVTSWAFLLCRGLEWRQCLN